MLQQSHIKVGVERLIDCTGGMCQCLTCAATACGFYGERRSYGYELDSLGAT